MDYQPAVAQCAGIGRYTRVLAAELARLLDGGDALSLFHCDFRRRSEVTAISGAETVAFRLLPGAIMQKLWHHAQFPPFNWLAGDADVYHFPNFTTRPLSRGRSVVSIHDMSFERYPQFAEKRNLRHLRAAIRRTADEADAIITISAFSRDEIESLLPAARGKVHVTHLGIGSQFCQASAAAVAAVKKRLGLVRPFMLTVGTVEPRKNLEFLVDVFERLAGQGIDLVVAGAPGWRCDPIFRRFSMSRHADQFHYLRYVPDGDLAALYTAATLFVIPSHYEGFGFSPLEAMACGTPVLSSAGGSLPEVLGEAARIVQGYDPDEWAQAALTFFQDSDCRSAFMEAGILRASRYSWRETAAQTLRVYRKVACV